MNYLIFFQRSGTKTQLNNFRSHPTALELQKPQVEERILLQLPLFNSVFNSGSQHFLQTFGDALGATFTYNSPMLSCSKLYL